MLGCGSTKSNKTEMSVDSAMVAEKMKTDKPIIEEPAGMYQRDSAIISQVTEATDAAMPKCIKNKIDSFKVKEAHEKPQRVIEYIYKGKKVYYMTTYKKIV